MAAASEPLAPVGTGPRRHLSKPKQAALTRKKSAAWATTKVAHKMLLCATASTATTMGGTACGRMR